MSTSDNIFGIHFHFFAYLFPFFAYYCTEIQTEFTCLDSTRDRTTDGTTDEINGQIDEEFIRLIKKC